MRGLSRCTNPARTFTTASAGRARKNAGAAWRRSVRKGLLAGTAAPNQAPLSESSVAPMVCPLAPAARARPLTAATLPLPPFRLFHGSTLFCDTGERSGRNAVFLPDELVCTLEEILPLCAEVAKSRPAPSGSAPPRPRQNTERRATRPRGATSPGLGRDPGRLQAATVFRAEPEPASCPPLAIGAPHPTAGTRYLVRRQPAR